MTTPALIETYVGNRSPSLTDTITVNGAAFDLTGSTVKFRMRSETSAALKVDAAATVVVAASGKVQYDWAGADVDTPGRYMAWWRVTLSNGLVQDSPEFEVDVLAHDGTTIAADLCSLEEVKLIAGLPDSRDAIAQLCISQASLAIAERYEREFVDSGQGATRRFETDSPRISLAPYDLQSASSVVLHPETTSPITLAANSGMILRPIGKTIGGTYTSIVISGLQPIISQTTIRYGVALVDVTGVWGMPSIPASVRRAAAITAAAWTDRASAEYGLDIDGVAGQNTPAFAQTWAIPTAAHRLLQRYERAEYA